MINMFERGKDSYRFTKYEYRLSFRKNFGRNISQAPVQIRTICLASP